MNGNQFLRCQRATGMSDAEWSAALGLVGRARAVREMRAGKRLISGPVARLSLLLAGAWPHIVDEPSLWEPAHMELDDATVAAFLSRLPANG